MPRGIIHYHIFKNAGTSIDRSLQAHFRSEWTTFEGDSATDLVSSARLNDFIRAHPAYRAISSHLARPPLPAGDWLPLVMLRHPIERARSVQRFAARDPGQPDHRFATKGLADYIRWALDSNEGGVVVRNYQVIHLSAASFRAPHIYLATAGEADLADAAGLLEAWACFGIVDRFAESCRLFQARIAPHFPGLQFKPVHDNASDPHPPSLADSLAEIRQELGPGLYQSLVEVNDLDLRLYAGAVASFSRLCRGIAAT